MIEDDQDSLFLEEALKTSPNREHTVLGSKTKRTTRSKNNMDIKIENQQPKRLDFKRFTTSAAESQRTTKNKRRKIANS